MEKLTITQKIGIAIVLLTTGLCLFAIYRYWLADYKYAEAKTKIQNGYVIDGISDYENVIKLSPNEALYKSKLGTTYSDLAKYFAENDELDKATASAKIAVFFTEEAKRLSPRNFVIGQERVISYSQLVSTDPKYLTNTIVELQSLAVWAPTYPKIYYRLGLAYKDIGQTDLAIQNFKKAIELKPDYNDAKIALDQITTIPQ
ncbi:MAG: tetratricopeptide repeat protein [Patescibacteria group bacterium]